MPDNKVSNENRETQDITQLRQAVLEWIEPKIKTPLSEPKKILNQSTTLPPKKIRAILPPEKSKGKKFKIALAILFIIVILGAVFGAMIYKFQPSDPATLFITKVTNYPVALVNWQPISYWEWQKQLGSLNLFYQKEKNNNSDFIIPSVNETEKHLLERMINLELLKQLAAKYNISVSPAEIDQQTKILAEEIGDQNSLEKQLTQLYGWSIDDFKQTIIFPIILKNKIQLALTLDDRINEPVRLKAKLILAEIKENQDNFSALARKYSEDDAASSGGDLSYLGHGQMLPEIEQAAFTLDVGEVSDLIKTKFGYHIIKVEEKLKDDFGKVTQVGIRQILIRTQDLETYLANLKNQTKIWLLIDLKM